jgi:hypothetical protein
MKRQVIAALLKAARPDLANVVAHVVTAERKLDRTTQQKVNKELIKAGLDGNGRFRKIGEAIAAIAKVFGRHGLEEDDVFNADLFRGNDGRRTFGIAYSNADDPFSPEAIGNSMLVIQWHLFEETGQYEVIAYLS